MPQLLLLSLLAALWLSLRVLRIRKELNAEKERSKELEKNAARQRQIYLDREQYEKLHNEAAELRDKEARLQYKVAELQRKVTGIRDLLNVARLELAGDVEGLTKIVQVYARRNARVWLEAKKALHRLGYQCVLHSEEGHMVQESVCVKTGWLCSSSDANSNCYAYCVNGDQCRDAVWETTESWVVDVPASVEVKPMVQ